MSGDLLVLHFYACPPTEVVVELKMYILTLVEAQEHEMEVRRAIRDGLITRHGLNSVERCTKRKAVNILDSKWVLTRKMVECNVAIKVRLTARVFKDAEANEVSSFADTCTLMGQRVVDHLCVQNQWELCVAYVGQAFLQTLSFERRHQLDEKVHREETGYSSTRIYLQLFCCTYQATRRLLPLKEIPRLMREGFRLKAAPRLWQKMPQHALEKARHKSDF